MAKETFRKIGTKSTFTMTENLKEFIYTNIEIGYNGWTFIERYIDEMCDLTIDYGKRTIALKRLTNFIRGNRKPKK